ncbi:MAG: cystathionine beta-lyase [Micavibrio sp.]|nr:cystathionine beta-lyase [Micavibrio sp.]
MKDKSTFGENTRLVHLGREPDKYYGVVNPPISRSSTILYDSIEAYSDPKTEYRYGRLGTPITKQFEKAMSELEGGYGAIAAPSGQSAITTSLLAFLKAGDHVLIIDSLYPPVRYFCNNMLARYGIDVEYYSAHDDLAARLKPNTAVIYMESPGSATFEIQDVPAIVKLAKSKNIVTIIDNSWAGGYLYKPFDHGVDISLQSCSKYIGGHSDIIMGVSVARDKEHYKPLRAAANDLGVTAGPDDIYLALRGLRTMPLRFKQAQENTMAVLDGIKNHTAIERLFYPALPDDPNHALWKRDFKGANGVFSALIKSTSKDAVCEAVNSLKLIPVGSSWGGYESLLQPQYLEKYRSANPWENKGAMLRFHIGLEDPDDLITDLRCALDKLL